MRSVGLAFLVRVATFPVTALATLLTTYLTIQYTGSEAYGAIMLVATLFQLIPFADLGMGAVVVNVVADPDSTKDQRNRTVAGVFRVLVLAGAVVALFGLSGATLFSWSHLLGVGGTLGGLDASTAAALAIYGMAVPFAIGQRILVGIGKNHVGIAISAASSLVTLIITFILVTFAAPLVLLAVAVPLGVLVSSVIGFVIGSRTIDLRVRRLMERAGVSVRTLAKTAGPMLVIMVGLPLALHSGRIFLARSEPAQTLSEFTLAMQLYSPLWSFVAAASMSLWPMFARSTGAPGDSQRLVRKSLIVFTGAGIVGGLLLVAGGPWIGTLISDGSIDLSIALMASIACVLLVQTMQQVPGMFLTSSAGLRFQAICVVALTAFVIIGTWAATPLLGAVGPPLILASGVLLFQFIPGLVRVSAITGNRAG